tara:strand:- start:6345 stop:6662 length:318 start_codon:yes stop_codon:yes gene_type:complete
MDTISQDYLIRALFSFVFVIIMIAVAVWWLKMKGTSIGSPDGLQIKVIGRVQIDSKHKLLLASIRDQHFLIGTSPAGISVTPLEHSASSGAFDDIYQSELKNQLS